MEGEGGDRPHPDVRRPPMAGESDIIDIKHGIKRARDDRWFMGVCGGIAHTFEWRPNTVRLVMVIQVCVRSEHAHHVCPACDCLLRRGEEPGRPIDETVHVERGKAMQSAIFESAADDGWSRLDYPGQNDEQTVVPN